jgi:hypothetical protein
MVMASMFLGNDDHTRAYCVVGAKMHIHGGDEYHIFDEAIGRLSPEFTNELRDLLKTNCVERVILGCNDEDLSNRMRKELGARMIFEDEKRKNNSSIILRDWFARNKPGMEEPMLKVWSECYEAIRSNYPPVRDCLVRMLEYYDKRMRAKIRIPMKAGVRSGYG